MADGRSGASRDAGAPARVSVVIPTYQSAHWVGDAIDSVLAQDPAPAEVIVVDDGSTDDTREVLASYGDRLQVIRRPNGGVAAARNTGARAATGDFLAFLDADDLFLPGRIAAVQRAIAEHPDTDLFTTDAQVTLDGVHIRTVYRPGNPWPTGDLRAEILRRSYIFGHVIVRRSRHLELGGYDETLRKVEDWDFWIRLVLAGSLPVLIAEPLSVNRMQRSSMSDDAVGMWIGRLEVLDRARRTPDLTDADHEIVRDSTALAERELAIAQLRRALRTEPTAIRKRARVVLRTPAMVPAARVSATVGLLAPRLAHRLAIRRPEHAPGAPT